MKYNPFFSSEFQETMKRISNIHLECVRNALPNAMTSQIQQIQESLTAPCRELIQSYSSIMSSSLASQVSQLSESLNSTIRDNIATGLYSALSESLKNDFSYRELQQQILNLTPALRIPSKPLDYPEDLGGLPKDDYVIVDEQAVNAYELPDSVYIPIGNSRIKMPSGNKFKETFEIKLSNVYIPNLSGVNILQASNSISSLSRLGIISINTQSTISDSSVYAPYEQTDYYLEFSRQARQFFTSKRADIHKYLGQFTPLGKNFFEVCVK